MNSRSEAERRYTGLRGRAYQAAEARLRSVLQAEDLSLRPITNVALDAFEREWQSHPQRRVGWAWRPLVEGLKRTPARFSLSVWHGETLCGLAIGRPSAGPTFCAVSNLEGAPDATHPLKGRVVVCVLTALEAYTIAIGRGEMRLTNPITDVVPIYETFGFRLVQQSGTAPYYKRTVPK
jgi:hypothetical protein